MKVYFGADHRGFRLKQQLLIFVRGLGFEAIDLGNTVLDMDDDYADFAAKVGGAVGHDPEHARGIVLCGSGAGVDATVNKVKGVRATIGFSSAQITDARRDDDINILALASGFLGETEAEEIVERFLKTLFSGEERHKRRIEKITAIENG